MKILQSKILAIEVVNFWCFFFVLAIVLKMCAIQSPVGLRCHITLRRLHDEQKENKNDKE